MNMAGPTVSIVVPKTLSSEQLEAVRNIIFDVAEWVDGFNFSINNHAFLWDHGEEFPGEFEEYKGFSEAVWKPQDQIGLIAMCNREIDHRNLAELACLVADQVNGMIQLGGCLDIEQNSHHQGSLYKAYYETWDNNKAFFHVCDVTFLRWWSTSPSFRMIK